MNITTSLLILAAKAYLITPMYGNTHMTCLSVSALCWWMSHDTISHVLEVRLSSLRTAGVNLSLRVCGCRLMAWTAPLSRQRSVTNSALDQASPTGHLDKLKRHLTGRSWSLAVRACGTGTQQMQIDRRHLELMVFAGHSRLCQPEADDQCFQAPVFSPTDP